MSTTVMTLGVFAVVALIMFALGAAWMARGNASERLRSMLGEPQAPKPKLAERLRTTLEKAMSPAARMLPLSSKEVSQTRRWLTQAGYREPRH
ncbi:MAG: hypothetical protein ACRD1F_12805, partial [Terriglobales bacterium]